MNGSTDTSHLVGIQLKTDGFISQNSFQTENNGLVIGSIMCPDLSLLSNELRQYLISKLPSVPPDFRFLSKHGWPIEKTEEANVKVSQLLQSGLVTIQKYFELPRLGIKWQDGKYLGFIFINFNCHLTEVRNKIRSDLGDKFFHLESDFEFLDKNEWPVAQVQENELAVWDICNGNYCIINKLPYKMKPEVLNHKTKKRPLKLSDKQSLKKQVRIETCNPNSILISYVHGEATTHARNLKIELRNMGLESVFLDVDDILPGHDWQDVINNALNSCTAFVALVTPRYGETRWTNREAKLADDKEKLIIPISFLEKWPPDQLAIQFLSLQYIPWKTVEEFADDEDGISNDITSWDPRCVHRVAKEIRKLCSELDVSTPDSLSLLDVNHLSASSSVSYSSSMKDTKKDYIVISAHSKQQLFVENIIKMLTKEQFDVWPSIEMGNINGDVVDSSCDDSQISEASPILESYCHVKEFKRSNFLSNSSHSESYDMKIDHSTWNHPAEKENLQRKIKHFKKKIKEACLVIIVMSNDYILSRICLQQAFYCEYRREVLVIKYGEFAIDDGCILNFYPEQDMLKFTGEEDDNDVLTTLKKEITKIMHEDTSRKSYKDRIQKMVANVSSDLKIETCVYVIGGTSGVSKNAEMFCIALGAELAKLTNLVLVTEGFFGAGDLIGKNFCEEREIRAKAKPHGIYHVIPHKDSNITQRARQKEDGSFDKIPYGQTLFYGDSIAERDDIVSATFKMCILVEGGQRSACLAEKFLFNDCTVIPIIFNNHAISSKRCLSESLSKLPCGVHQIDWSALLNCKTPPDALAKTVKKIVLSLLKTRKICSLVSNGA